MTQLTPTSIPAGTGRPPGEADATLPPLTARWRRVFKDRRLMHHNRLVVSVLLANTAYAWWILATSRPAGPAAADAVLVNVTLTVLVRQQRVINLLFALATSVPRTAPLRLRWTLGKVYHFGGLHVGGALATTAWFTVSAVHTLTRPPGGPTAGSLTLIGLTWLILGLLVGMLLTARPGFRARRHDVFERVHRFAGWGVLVLFAAQAVLSVALTEGLSAGSLLTQPAVWVLVVVVLSVASTWLHLRRVPVTYTRPSRHVVLAHFEHRTPFAGSSTALSRHPLREWHHFANVPAPGRDGFRLTVSRAGDWTGALIDDLPSTVWVKGIPTAGVGNIDRLFRRVLWVATGSGIGPCLPHLLAGDTPADLVWSTRSPRATYGDDLVEEILAVQPDALIWDSTVNGKPDLVALAFAALRRSGAEAVICISNKPTTWTVVEAFERRGVPAFGAIWDS